MSVTLELYLRLDTRYVDNLTQRNKIPAISKSLDQYSSTDMVETLHHEPCPVPAKAGAAGCPPCH